MIIKVHYNKETGDILGFYPEDIKYKYIPTPNIDINEKDHQKLINNAMAKVIDGKLSYLTDEEIALYEKNKKNARPWQQKRIEAYLPIGDQLDMIYHDQMNGTNNWLNHITSVKEKIPKK